MRRKILWIVAFAAMVGLTNGAAVQPWQKGELADPIMIFNENSIDAGINEHYLEYREGSSGGTGAQSGGCGC